MEHTPSKKRKTHAVSRVLADGTIVEIVHSPENRQTQFAVSRGQTISLENEIELDGELLLPYSPENNLIAHGAVLLPSVPEPCDSLSELRDRVRAFIHRYVDLTPAFERIATQYVFLTWVHDAFNELPYLRLQGDYGTGKTRTLLVLGSLAYRGFFASGASTVSPIFHTLNALGGTLILDEADFRMSDEKADLVKILNNGTVKGIPVLRTLINQKHEFNPAAFQVFGPKIVATRGTYEDRALESRFLTELMGGRPLRGDVPINLPASFKEEALAIRNQLLWHRLMNFHHIRLDPSLADATLEARHNQILIPLLSITEDTALREEMRESLRTTGQTLLAERSVSIEGELLAVVLDLFNEHEGSIPMKLVREAFIDAHGSDFERAITTRYLAGVLRRKLSIRIMKSMGVMSIPHSEESRIREIGKRFGLDNLQSPPSRDLGRKGDTGEGQLPVAPTG